MYRFYLVFTVTSRYILPLHYSCIQLSRLQVYLQ